MHALLSRLSGMVLAAWLSLVAAPAWAADPAGTALATSLATCLHRTDKSELARRLCMPVGPRLALVVGQADYKRTHKYVGQDWSLLPIAGRDATAMAAQLSENGFTLVGGGPQLNLTKTQFNAAIAHLVTLARGRNATVLIYLSGHGFSSSGRALVAPIDTPKPILGVETRVQDNISVTEIEAAIEQAQPRLQIILLDACRDALKSFGPVSGDQDPIKPATLLGLAGEPGAAVPIEEGQRLSAYTAALVEQLSDFAEGTTLTQLFLDVSSAVASLSNQAQVPVFRYGDHNMLRLLNAAAVFGFSRVTLAAPQAVAVDKLVDRFGVVMLDYALACEPVALRDNNPFPPEAGEFYASVLLMANDPESVRQRCDAIEKEVNDRAVPEAVREQVHRRLLEYPIGLVKQVAQQGDAHANLLVFMFVISDASNIIFNREMFQGYLQPNRRIALEYLFRAADGGNLMAALLLGQHAMPALGEKNYYTSLPGSYTENYERGRRYLEYALREGLGDAGLILAYNAGLSFTNLNTHKEKYRLWVEAALKQPIRIFPPDYVLGVRYRLADDYLGGETGPVIATRGLELLREVAEATASDEDGKAAKGKALWRLAIWSMKQSGTAAAAAIGENPIYTYTRRAGDLGVKEALDFAADAYLVGRYGFALDGALSDAARLRASNATITSGYSVRLTSRAASQARP